MDIIRSRGQLDKIRRDEKPADWCNPLITKPSVNLSVRQIVERYSRGEIGYVPEQIKETILDSDEYVDKRAYSSELDKEQRVEDFRKEFNQKLKDYESSVNDGKQKDSSGDSEPSE